MISESRSAAVATCWIALDGFVETSFTRDELRRQPRITGQDLLGRYFVDGLW